MAKKRKQKFNQLWSGPFGGFDPNPEANPQIGGKPLQPHTIDTTQRLYGRITLTDLRERFGILDHAVVTVRVPGGGDWSNTDLKMGLPNGDGEFAEIEVTWDEKGTESV